MKKLFLIAFGLVIMSGAQAQEDQKTQQSNTSSNSTTMWLGGGINYTSTNGDGIFTLAPSFGMMINENMAIGGTLQLSGGSNTSGWALIPYFRYYMPVTDKFSLYGDAYIAIAGGDNDTTDDNFGSYSAWGIGVSPGVQYWFTPQWSISTTVGRVGYQSSKFENQNDPDTKFNLNVDFTAINFSLLYHF
ncbi:MAG: outer membrane beta-barrel protein [Bacteroidota bacterium]